MPRVGGYRKRKADRDWTLFSLSVSVSPINAQPTAVYHYPPTRGEEEPFETRDPLSETLIQSLYVTHLFVIVEVLD